MTTGKQMAQVIAIRPEIQIKGQSVAALTQQAKATWDRADEKKSDADDWFFRTGKILLELKENTKHGEWLKALKKIGRSQSRAKELMALARGETTIEEQRERAREGMKKSRVKRRNVTALSPAASKKKKTYTDEEFREWELSKEDVYGDSEDPPEMRWEFSLRNLFSDILTQRAMWTKLWGSNWKQFKLSATYHEQAKEALAEFTSIVKEIEKKGK